MANAPIIISSIPRAIRTAPGQR